MRHASKTFPLDIRQLAVAASMLVAMAGGARAEDLVGLYIGGGIGQSRVEATSPAYGTEEFKANHSAFDVMLGMRPISLLGAEVSYIDFGHPSGNLGFFPANTEMKGAAAFGIVYLPVPVVDVYFKAGLARIESTVNGTYPITCGIPCGSNLFQLSRTNTSGAGGLGAQFKFGPVALRAEYERFNAAGGNPSLLSLGVIWTFF